MLSRLQRGDESAFDDLVARHAGRLRRFADRLLGWRDGADDVVQEVLVKLHRGAAGIRGDSKLTTWLHTVTVREVRSRRRSLTRRLRTWWEFVASRHDRVGTSDPARSVDPLRSDRTRPATGRDEREPSGLGTARLAVEETVDAVRLAVSRLPDPWREAVVLHHLEGHGVAESAELLGITPNAMSLRLLRARERLRELLAPP